MWQGHSRLHNELRTAARTGTCWDRGLWDQAHWNGQLGVQITAASFVFNGQTAHFGLNLRLIAETASVVFTGPDVQFVVMHPLHCG